MKVASALRPILLATAIVGASLPAFADVNMHAVVHSSNGQVVTSSSGQCVRTRWNSNADECAPVVILEAQQVTQIIRPATRTEIDAEQRTAYFAFNKSDLTAEAQAKLDSLTTVLRSASDVKDVRIVGYADRIGSVTYNDRLSQERAETVKDYIIGHGYANASVAKTRWLGKSAPVTNCPAKMKRVRLIKCLQADRRVEVVLDYAQQVPSAQ